MGILDKKLFLADLQTRLDDFIPANTARQIIEQAADVLTSYDMSANPSADGGVDESESLIRLFLDAKAVEGRSAQTIKQYGYVLENMRRGVGAPLSKVTVHHLRSFFMREKERGVSMRTLEGYRYVLQSFYGWLWREELISKNPTVNLQPIRHEKVIRKPFSTVEIEKMKEAAKSTRDKAIICFLLATGCRISEMCKLNTLDIDFQARAVTVLGKGNKQRRVYLDDVSILYLHRYFREREDSSEALFVGKGSARLTPGGVRYTLKQIEKQTGIENVHPHRFRRTLATSLISHGMAVQEVAAVLGHDKLDTTMQYVFIDQRAVENAYRKYA